MACTLTKVDDACQAELSPQIVYCHGRAAVDVAAEPRDWRPVTMYQLLASNAHPTFTN